MPADNTGRSSYVAVARSLDAPQRSQAHGLAERFISDNLRNEFVLRKCLRNGT